MSDRIEKVVVLGGGTAGWMTASYLGKSLDPSVSITVLEAPSIPKIGVGEATVPNLQRVFFDHLGIAEDEWMSQCNASFKMAVKFVNWTTPGGPEPTGRDRDGRPDHFYHPFGLLPAPDGVPLSHHWSRKVLGGTADQPFDYSCFVEPPVMDANLAPRYRDGRPATNYAWHFDAHLVADFLRRFAVEKQGAEHIEDLLVGVERTPNGDIAALRTQGGRRIEGDLFIDCSGFRSLLLNQELEEPFLDMSDHLVNNRAVAAPVTHDDDAHGVEPYTSSIAMPSGWAWRIPMLGRFGSGYVYSDAFCEPDQAAREFCQLWGLDPDGTPLNHIQFRVGRNRRAWVRNCVSIGLSSCFLEPLESTGIYFITASLFQLAKHFPSRSFEPTLRDRFNREVEEMFDDTRDFLQAHFSLSPRTDTPYWRAMKDLKLADQIKEKIAMYKAGIPINAPATDEGTYYGNFEAEFRNFWTNGSYHAIFAGLGVRPDASLPILDHQRNIAAHAEESFARVAQRQQSMLAELPANLEFLRKLHSS